jgi:hypothetical protein
MHELAPEHQDARIQSIVHDWPQQVDGSRAVAIGVPQPPALEKRVRQCLEDFGPRSNEVPDVAKDLLRSVGGLLESFQHLLACFYQLLE